MLLALFMGLKASINPFMLATVLIYVSLLSLLTHTRRQLIISGFFYVLSVWSVNFLVLVGSYDHLIYRSFFSVVISLVYSIIVILFIYTGWLHLHDWIHVKKHQDVLMFRVRSPRSLDGSPKTKHLLHTIVLVFVFMVTGWVISVFEARLSQNYYLFVTMQRLIKAKGTFTGAYFSFATYMLAYSWSLIFVWALYVIDSFSIRTKTWFNRFIIIEKLIYAALYWAVSVGIMYYLLNVIQL